MYRIACVAMRAPLICCLAYGSNLHPFRLMQRVPSAQPIGVVSMSNKRIAFHKRSIDGSGKCLFYESVGPDNVMYGVAYEFDASEKGNLDRLEGLNQGYNEQLVAFPLNSVTCEAFVYVAASTHIDPSLAPYDWYKEMVVLGARYHRLPAGYIAQIEAVASIPDVDRKRAADNAAILDNMRRMNALQGC